MKARAAFTPIVLIALATGAVAYAYLLDRDKVSDADRAARRKDVFPSFRVDDVQRIEIDHGAEKLVLEREQDAGSSSSWAMTSPRREHADSAAVDALLRELELGTWLRRVTDADTLGLAAPRATGEIALGPLDYHFAVGADAPTPDGAAYMKLEGEGTFVVGRSLAVQLLRGANAYRERALVPYGGNDVARMAVLGDGGGFMLERHGATFRTKGGLRASRDVVERILLALADARAEVFLDDAAADERTKAPVLTLAIDAPDGSKPHVELRVGAPCPGRPEDVVVVRTAPARISACTSKGLVEALRPEGTALVDESPFFARFDEIEELRLEPAGSGGPAVDLARRGTSWHERAPEDRELASPEEADAANALAASVVGAKGTEVHRPGPHETIVPFARASLVRTGDATRELVEISRPLADGTVVVRRADDGALLRLALPDARHLFPRPIALRARPVWRAPFDPASVTAIDDACGPTQERLELQGHAWTLLAPPGFAADPVSAADLASAIARAKADAWVAGSDDGSFGFGGPGACAVEVSLSSPSGQPSRRASIVFGKPGEGGVYAHTLDDPAVFVAPAVLYGLMTRPAIDRSAFRVEPAESATITLEQTGVRVRLSRQGSALVREGSSPQDAGAADSIERALASFYALAALHAGPPGKDEGMDRPALAIDLASEGRAPVHVTIGTPTRVDGIDAYFARVRGIDASFAVPKAPVEALLGAR